MGWLSWPMCGINGSSEPGVNRSCWKPIWVWFCFFIWVWVSNFLLVHFFGLLYFIYYFLFIMHLFIYLLFTNLYYLMRNCRKIQKKKSKIKKAKKIKLLEVKFWYGLFDMFLIVLIKFHYHPIYLFWVNCMKLMKNIKTNV